MKKAFAAAFVLVGLAAACALAEALPEMKATLFYTDSGINAHLYFTPDERLYVTTDYLRFGETGLDTAAGNAEAQWTESGKEVAVFLNTMPLPETDWPQFEARLTFLSPVRGMRSISIQSDTALSQTNAALDEGLTPVDAEEPHTVLVGKEWFRDYEMEEMAEEDGPLYVPFIGRANSEEGGAEELVRYANMRIVGRRKLSFDFMEEETRGHPVSVTAMRVEPVAVSLPDGDATLLTVIEDEANTFISPEKAAEIAALELAKQYALEALEFSYMEGNVMLLHPPEGPESVWVVNLMDAFSGKAMDYAAQVDASTGEVLWAAGPGEGNG